MTPKFEKYLFFCKDIGFFSIELILLHRSLPKLFGRLLWLFCSSWYITLDNPLYLASKKNLKYAAMLENLRIWGVPLQFFLNSFCYFVVAVSTIIMHIAEDVLLLFIYNTCRYLQPFCSKKIWSMENMIKID